MTTLTVSANVLVVFHSSNTLSQCLLEQPHTCLSKYIHEIDDNHSCRRYLDCQSYVMIYISSEKCILDEISFGNLDNLMNDIDIRFVLQYTQFEINQIKCIQF